MLSCPNYRGYFTRKETYYGYFMMNMKFEADFNSQYIAGIRLNSYPPVFVSNPLLLCKWSLQEILYTICHEIEHVLLNHPAEMVKCNPDKDPEMYERFNLAADASVNDRLDEEIRRGYRFLARPDGVINSSVFAEIFGLKNVRKLENYLYYLNLIRDKNVDISQREMVMSKIRDSDDVSDVKDSLDDNSKKEEIDKEKKTGYSSEAENATSKEDKPAVVVSSNADFNSDHQWCSDEDEDYDEIFANTKEFINQSFDIMNEETRGTMPGFFLSQVEKINEPPKIRWSWILKRYVGTVSADQIHTRMRLNRRQPDRFDLSGKKSDKVVKIVVAIDTSSSVDDRQISDIFNEIFAILSKKKYEITVIECDSAIQRIYQVRRPSEVKLGVRGRGGTSFIPVIKYINQERRFRDSLLVYFTDGYGDSRIPKPLTYRNLWVITRGDEKRLSLKEPYGRVIAMEEKGR